jgi:hypothetical protein
MIGCSKNALVVPEITPEFPNLWLLVKSWRGRSYPAQEFSVAKTVKF